jgi:Fe-S cluster assembly protein SufD
MGEKRAKDLGNRTLAATDDGRGLYLAVFSRAEKELASIGPPAVHRARKAGIARFGEVGFPTTHDEEWRFTNIAPLTRVPFLPAFLEPIAAVGETPSMPQMIFINSKCSQEYASKRLPAGVIVGRLSQAFAQTPSLVERYLTRLARVESSPFTALNTAFLHDGAFIYVPKGVVVEEPICLSFLSRVGEQPLISHARVLVIAEEGAQLTLVEDYRGADTGIYFTNAVTEMSVGVGAVVDHYKVQQESASAYHVATMQVQMAQGSRFSSHSLTFGGAITRNEVNAVLDAENCECTLNGLYMGSGTQLIDNHTRIDHAKPNCVSHELYKGILGGQSRGVFNGKIYVHPDAQKTDAKQTNKTLLLSDDAVIDTKPQLEIFADDVKCTHGATIGQLDADSIFYLRSRGIGLPEARSLLTYAFANDIVNRVKVDAVRKDLEQRLLAEQGLPAEGALP